MSIAKPDNYDLIAKNTSADHLGSIHTDESAQKFGYAGGLVPGITLLGYMGHALAAAWGHEWIRGGTIQSRSIRPAYEGEHVTVHVIDYKLDDALQSASFEVFRDDADKPVAVGSGTLPTAPPTAPAGDTYRCLPMPPTPPLAAVGAIPVGFEMGTTTQVLTAEDLEDYLGKLDESYSYYRDNGVFPPSYFQQLTTRVERDNFEYETPTIFVEGWVQTYDELHIGDTVRCPGVVTGFDERKGNHYVQVEQLVLAGDKVVAKTWRNSIYHARDSRE